MELFMKPPSGSFSLLLESFISINGKEGLADDFFFTNLHRK
jgi:hypothetical protein